jgi:hypothetical protein
LEEKQIFSLQIVNSFKNVMPLKQYNKSVDKLACTFVSRHSNQEHLGTPLNIPSTEKNMFRENCLVFFTTIPFAAIMTRP